MTTGRTTQEPSPAIDRHQPGRHDAPVLYVASPGHPRARIADRFDRVGYQATVAADVADAMGHLADRRFAVCVIDLTGDRASITTLRLIRARHPALPIVGVVDPAVPSLMADAVRNGLTDLVCWPYDDVDMAVLLSDAIDRGAAVPTAAAPGRDQLVALSPAMRDVLARAGEAASRRHAVLLRGAHGTGKLLVARALHAAVNAPAGPFVVVDGAGRAPSEVDRQLFGEVATPADATGPMAVAGDSAFARALGGTLFVRNIDAAPARVQRRLAGILREREVGVTGRGRTDLDLQLVATAPADDDRCAAMARELVDAMPVRIDLPPLDRRREDIPLLAVQFLQAVRVGERGPRGYSRAALELLAALPWPGNAAELNETVTGLAVALRRPLIQLDDVIEHVRIDGAPRVDIGLSLREARERFEREYISAHLGRHQGRVGEAARALGIQRTNLYRKVRQLGIPRALLSNRR